MKSKSGADSMHNMTIQMKVDNALQAVNFAKQREWKCAVDAPKFRQVPSFRLILSVNFPPIYVGNSTTLYIN